MPRTLALLALAVHVGLDAPAQVPRLPGSSIQSAAFLAGCWRQELPGPSPAARTIDEQWMAPAGGLMLGMSRTVAGGRAVEHEFVRIEERDGRLVYLAQPSGQPPAEFTAVRASPDELVFENLLHDFPQRIEYRRDGADRLAVRIEGTVNGTLRTRDFPYVRVACSAAH